MYHGEYRMTGSESAASMQAEGVAAQAQKESSPETITNRFGEVTIYRNNPIIFPTGMLGISDKVQFCLTHFPNEKLARFKLLQSLEDDNLAFITLPLDIHNSNLIAKEDVLKAAKDQNIDPDALGVLLVVSVHRDVAGTMKLTANLRAPILIDTIRRVAHQHVFSSSKYEIRYGL
jgi:flagellar assembly factor FliW